AGKPAALPVDEGGTLLPSVVSYRAAGEPPIVGHAARRRAADAPRDTIVSVKRFMGRSSADPETKRLSPYRFAEGESGTVRFEVKAVGGDSALGGDDFDRAIAQLVLDEMGGSRDPRLVRQAIDAARAAKEALTTRDAVEIELSGFRRTLTRAQLDAAIRPLIE